MTHPCRLPLERQRSGPGRRHGSSVPLPARPCCDGVRRRPTRPGRQAAVQRRGTRPLPPAAGGPTRSRREPGPQPRRLRHRRRRPGGTAGPPPGRRSPGRPRQRRTGRHARRRPPPRPRAVPPADPAVRVLGRRRPSGGRGDAVRGAGHRGRPGPGHAGGRRWPSAPVCSGCPATTRTPSVPPPSTPPCESCGGDRSRSARYLPRPRVIRSPTRCPVRVCRCGGRCRVRFGAAALR